MARVAVVTDGTRGIGGMVSGQLKAKGYTVAAIYGGNDEAAAFCGVPLVYNCARRSATCAAKLNAVIAI
jgi:acetoacetyl-CoA reductase